MKDYIEIVFAMILLSGAAIGAVLLILVMQPWFWLAVIAITLINHFN